MCRRWVWKDHSLKTGFGNVSTTEKKKIATGLGFQDNQKPAVKFSFKTLPSQKLKETKPLYLETVGVWGAEESEFSRQMGWLLFWLHLDGHGLHSSRKNTRGCSSLYARRVADTEKYTGRKRARKRRLREGFRDENWNKTWLGYKFIRSCAHLFLKVLHLHSKNCPPNPKPAVPALELLWKSMHKNCNRK